MKDYRKIKKRLLALALAALAVCSAVGGTYAWLANAHKLNTISLVQMPSKITISGSQRSEMTRINLELTEDDTQDETTVTINRVFCIESMDNFYLEVAHTTNIDNMQIAIYPVSVANSEQLTGTKADGWISSGDGSSVLYYLPDADAIAGGYLNEASGVADSTYHDKNYDEDDEMQCNAEPLFWISAAAEDFDRTDYCRTGRAEDGVTDIAYRYYVLQLSWDASTQETDLVYLLASHAEA